jgi:hypothetical protein
MFTVASVDSVVQLAFVPEITMLHGICFRFAELKDGRYEISVEWNVHKERTDLLEDSVRLLRYSCFHLLYLGQLVASARRQTYIGEICL